MPKKDLLVFAKAMRTKPTEAERRLWYFLRAKRFAGYKFKRQVVIGSYIVDFLADVENLVIEIDGGQHSEKECKANDTVRTEYLKQCGYRVLRFWNNEVLGNTEAVLEVIYRELKG